MAQKGINLGGWLVLERWMTPSLFVGTDAHDEHTLVSLGAQYQSRIEKHYQTFITKKDIAWLHDHGITQLRVPIGYWLFGDQSPFVSSIKYLDQLFDWADEFDIKIIISIHAAPGSQNGEHHSGKIGRADWYRQRTQLAEFTQRVVKRYQKREVFIGLCLLNEPHRSLINIPRLIWYYPSIIRRIRKSSPLLHLYIDGTFHKRLWILVAKFLRVGVDLHLYHGFDNANETSAVRKLRASSRVIRSKVPLIIGEWSGVIHHQPDQAATKHYINTQRKAYSPAIAEFYWTYKTETGAPWSYRDLRK